MRFAYHKRNELIFQKDCRSIFLIRKNDITVKYEYVRNKAIAYNLIKTGRRNPPCFLYTLKQKCIIIKTQIEVIEYQIYKLYTTHMR